MKHVVFFLYNPNVSAILIFRNECRKGIKVADICSNFHGAKTMQNNDFLQINETSSSILGPMQYDFHPGNTKLYFMLSKTKYCMIVVIIYFMI